MSGQVAGYKSISTTVVGKLSLDEFHLHHILALTLQGAQYLSAFTIPNFDFFQSDHSQQTHTVTAEGNWVKPLNLRNSVYI